jgi:hypothetical protein
MRAQQQQELAITAEAQGYKHDIIKEQARHDLAWPCCCIWLPELALGQALKLRIT